MRGKSFTSYVLNEYASEILHERAVRMLQQHFSKRIRNEKCKWSEFGDGERADGGSGGGANVWQVVLYDKVGVVMVRKGFVWFVDEEQIVSASLTVGGAV